MTDEKKPPQRKQRAATRPRAGKAATAAKPPAQRKAKYTPEMIAAARALWEGDPKITKADVAREMGIPYCMVDKWSKGGQHGTEEKWAKRVDDNMSERAYKAADTYRGKLNELGPEITTEQRQQAEEETAEETAVELRARVLERHRKEWNVPRALVSEAVKARDFGKAKLAKITSETLKIIQDAERKAWGVDSGSDTKIQVVIERE